MVATWHLFARAAPRPVPRLWDQQLVISAIALVGVILVGTIVLILLDRWRKRSPAPSVTTKDQLANFRQLYEKGELSEQEFQRIQATLRPRLLQEIQPVENPPAADQGKETPP